MQKGSSVCPADGSAPSDGWGLFVWVADGDRTDNPASNPLPPELSVHSAKAGRKKKGNMQSILVPVAELKQAS